MLKIMILHEDAVIRAQLSAILRGGRRKVFECSTLEEANNLQSADIDLFICGQFGKYSDGLLFAAERAMENRKVIIISDRRKFSRIPFLHTNHILRPGTLIAEVRGILTGS